mmetsp:Transcript_27571/g.61064  ORF Transcript_27571/g.61064 Transcript_27571/m.61064 type:complete len:284 (+) Transcript_27571:419-1270(+)
MHVLARRGRAGLRTGGHVRRHRGRRCGLPAGRRSLPRSALSRRSYRNSRQPHRASTLDARTLPLLERRLTLLPAARRLFSARPVLQRSRTGCDSRRPVLRSGSADGAVPAADGCPPAALGGYQSAGAGCYCPCLWSLLLLLAVAWHEHKRRAVLLGETAGPALRPGDQLEQNVRTVGTRCAEGGAVCLPEGHCQGLPPHQKLFDAIEVPPVLLYTPPRWLVRRYRGSCGPCECGESWISWEQRGCGGCAWEQWEQWGVHDRVDREGGGAARFAGPAGAQTLPA